MKKTLLLTIIILSLFSQSSIAQNTCRIDTLLVLRYFENTDSTFFVRREIFSYNAEGYKTQQIYQNWSATDELWEGFARYTWEYSTTGKETNYKYYTFNAMNEVDPWQLQTNIISVYNTQDLIISKTNVNNNKELYSYDSNGNLTEKVIQSYNFSTDEFNNSDRIIYTFNSSNKLTEETNQFYNTGSGNWDNSTRIQYSYNSDGNLSSRNNQSFIFNNWINSFRSSFTYDSNDLLTEELLQSYNEGSSSWQNSDKFTYTYNSAGKVLTKLRQGFISGSWQNDTRETYTYNAANLELTYLNEQFSGGSWRGNTRITSTYDASNQRVSRLEEFFGVNFQWVNSRFDTWEYDQFGNEIAREENTSWDGSKYNARIRFENKCNLIETSIHNANKNFIGNVYPNPTTNLLFIDLVTSGEVSVYDLKGQKLIHSVNQQNHVIEVSHLTNGLYIVKTDKGYSKFIKN